MIYFNIRIWQATIFKIYSFIIIPLPKWKRINLPKGFSYVESAFKKKMKIRLGLSAQLILTYANCAITAISTLILTQALNKFRVLSRIANKKWDKIVHLFYHCQKKLVANISNFWSVSNKQKKRLDIAQHVMTNWRLILKLITYSARNAIKNFARSAWA